MNFQRTIQKEGSISGFGLHSGERSKIFFKPAIADFGVRFFKNDRLVEGFAESARCTAIGSGSQQILTVEHLLAALHGLGISNIRVDVEGPEIPGLDGSALPFVRLFRQLGIQRQKATADVYEIKEPIFCGFEGRAISIIPERKFSIAYVLDYPGTSLRSQIVDFTLTPKNFETQIAPARTFCTQEEAAALKKQGFGKGANTRNTLVISKRGALGNRFRFPDECARHKVLDILGDIALAGFQVLGRVVAIRSGHALNRELVQKIKNQREVI